MATATHLITAEQYARMPDLGVATELVRGEIVEMNIPKPRHGQICSRVDRIVGNYADEHDLGHVVCNDSGVITERDPDTVRGGDVWFISYNKVPKGPFSGEYLDVAPDIVFEVKSEWDRWKDIHSKVAEYLNCGVAVVCVLDPETRTIRLYYPDQPDVRIGPDDELMFPDQLPGFCVPARAFFE
jgi:Uma2 family endonuclease